MSRLRAALASAPDEGPRKPTLDEVYESYGVTSRPAAPMTDDPLRAALDMLAPGGAWYGRGEEYLRERFREAVAAALAASATTHSAALHRAGSRKDCPACQANDARLARPAVPVALDVERLAEAISQHHRRSYVDMIDTLAARSIAMKYAALRDTSGEGTE